MDGNKMAAKKQQQTLLILKSEGSDPEVQVALVPSELLPNLDDVNGIDVNSDRLNDDQRDKIVELWYNFIPEAHTDQPGQWANYLNPPMPITMHKMIILSWNA
jgi:hypothetical protein